MGAERTKIVVTLGPSSSDPATLGRLLDAGLNVVRLNFSHGEQQDHLDRIALVRRTADERRRNVAILADLQGPKIRVGKLGDDGVILSDGGAVTLVSGAETAPAGCVPVVYERLAGDVHAGDRILIDDGSIEVQVERVAGDEIMCRVVRAGIVRSRKGINLPGVAVSAPSLTQKDVADLETAVHAGVDYVALSFVRRAEDVIGCQAAIEQLGGDIPVVAKLERPEAVERLPEILTATDAVMVARGDLGVELPPEQVPAIQKDIIASANAVGVPVITATQMLESMVTNSRPTRAEASDVANAIFDGTDAVMLSQETAAGRYPVEAVETMRRIIRAAESTTHLIHPPPPVGGALDVTSTVCRAAVGAAADLNARAIVAFTESGATARYVSRFRPKQPIIGMTPHASTRRRLALMWGVRVAELLPRGAALDTMLARADQRLVRHGWATRGDIVVVVAGTPGGQGATNRVIVHRVGEHEAT